MQRSKAPGSVSGPPEGLWGVWLDSRGLCLLSCSWRPPPARLPAPPSEGRWGEVLSRSPAPRCSCSRSTFPTLCPDRPHSPWRCARSGFLVEARALTQRFSVTQEKLKRQSHKSYARCSKVWNCPWGSRGNCKAAQEGDKEEVLLLSSLSSTQKNAHVGGWCLTFIWACSPEYSMDWKMCQVYLRLISVRATYWRYHRWIRTAALRAETREN